MQSAVAPVKPGDVVYGNVTWDATTGTYTQQVGKSGSKPIVTKVTKAEEHSEVFTDVYVVVEHQPNSCAEVRGRRGSARAGGRARGRARTHILPSQYPSNNNVTFTDIQISWASGAPLTLSSWTVAAFKPACSSVAKMLSANSVQLLWKS